MSLQSSIIANLASVIILNYLVPWTSKRFAWWLQPDRQDAKVDRLGVGAMGGTPGAAPPAPTVVAQLRPIGPLDPTGSGTLTATERAGVRTMAVRLTGVPDAAGADYLEVWLMNGAGTEIVALGALTRDDTGYSGSFTVPSNLPMTQLDLVDVSAERYDGNPGHSGVSILRGTLA